VLYGISNKDFQEITIHMSTQDDRCWFSLQYKQSKT
jgi:hypothetical protein